MDNVISINKATVIRNEHAMDYVVFDTTLPPGVYPFKQSSHVSLYLAQGTAEQYIKDNFNDLPVEIVVTK